jgi:phosphoglycerate dehydrogenase-like enzyme
MRVAILDDVHCAYEGTEGIRRLRERTEVQIFTGPFGEPSALRGFDAVIANRERTRFTRALLEQLPDLRIIAQTGNHVYHVDLAAAEQRQIIVAKATGGGSTSAAELAIGLMIAVMRQIPSTDRDVKRGGGRRR